MRIQIKTWSLPWTAFFTSAMILSMVLIGVLTLCQIWNRIIYMTHKTGKSFTDRKASAAWGQTAEGICLLCAGAQASAAVMRAIL